MKTFFISAGGKKTADCLMLFDPTPRDIRNDKKTVFTALAFKGGVRSYLGGS